MIRLLRNLSKGAPVPVICACIVLICLATLVYARVRGIVFFGRTAAGLTIVHDDTKVLGERIRVLEVEGTYQSATFLDERWAQPVFHYHATFDHLFDAWPAGDGPELVAVLGGGGYAIPKHLVEHHGGIARVDVVEIDPAIERIARRHFFLDRLEARHGAAQGGPLHLHVGEASQWLEDCDLRFDVIINDCFFGFEPEERLASAHAARLIRQHLRPQGIYLVNVVSALQGPEALPLYEQAGALSRAFTHLWVYPLGADRPTLCDNNVLVASNASHPFVGAWTWPPE